MAGPMDRGGRHRMAAIQVGAPAPKFRARVAGVADAITLAGLRGRPVVLAF